MRRYPGMPPPGLGETIRGDPKHVLAGAIVFDMQAWFADRHDASPG
jgi:hypothetical protein